MNMQQFYTKYKGKSLAAPEGQLPGECVSMVRQYILQVDGLVNPIMGNAVDFWNNKWMLAHYDKVPAGKEKNGDILVWGDDPGNWTGKYGHIAVRYSPGKMLNQNFGGKRYVSVDNFFPQGYLGAFRKKPAPKGGDDMIEADDITEMRAVMRDIKGWNAKNVDSGKYDASEAKAWVGKTWETYITEGVKEGASFRTKRDAALAYYAKKSANDKALKDALAQLKSEQAQVRSQQQHIAQLQAQLDTAPSTPSGTDYAKENNSILKAIQALLNKIFK